MKTCRPTLSCLLLAFCAHTAWAQEDVRQYRTGDAVDPREVADILAPRAIKMRSLRLLDAGPGAAAAAGAASVAVPASARASALSLPLQFGFDSAELLDASKQQLDALAEGIRLLPEKQSVVVEGHTDANGGERYNETLSQRRAGSVKRYLVAVHGIDAQRLRVVAMGKHSPLPGLDPFAAENRRVQFRGE
jgi:outer membrane protein OmpA-like peptidoglycan-associated protein